MNNELVRRLETYQTTQFKQQVTEMQNKKNIEQVSIAQSEGDVNLSSARESWQRDNLDDEARALLAEDARYFLHQSLSSPCLNVLSSCEGSFLVDTQGRSYLDSMETACIRWFWSSQGKGRYLRGDGATALLPHDAIRTDMRLHWRESWPRFRLAR